MGSIFPGSGGTSTPQHSPEPGSQNKRGQGGTLTGREEILPPPQCPLSRNDEYHLLKLHKWAQPEACVVPQTSNWAQSQTPAPNPYCF